MRFRKLLIVSCLAAFSAVATPAWAGDVTLAEALFNQGRALMQEGKYAEAAQKFADSYAQDPAVGTQLNLANCHEMMGKLATAWGEYSAAAAAARDAGQADRQAHAQRKVKELEGKLSYVRVSVPAAQPDGLAIELDGKALPKSAWNAPVPIDPGEHRITVSAPGRRTAVLEIATQGKTTEVVVPELEQEPSADRPANERAVTSQDVATPAASSGRSSTLGWVGVGVGVAGVAAGAVTLAIGKSAEGKLEDACDGFRCPPESSDDLDRAEQMQTISLVSFIVGGVALAGGITWLVTAPTSPEKTSGARLYVGHRGAGVVGSF